MESQGLPARLYQDFEPSMEWVPEDDSDTLLLYLPGFAKEQLRVQLRARNLILSGERKLHKDTWSRFRVEFPVSGNCDLNKISAKFEGNILFVRQPKLITTAKPEQVNPPPALQHDEPAAVDEESNNISAAAAPTTNTIQSKTTEKKQLVAGKDDVPAEACDSKVAEEEEEEEVCETDSLKKKKKTAGKSTGVKKGEVDHKRPVVDKYNKLAVGAVGMKLKRWSNYAIVVLVVGLAVAIYVLNDSIRKSWSN